MENKGFQKSQEDVSSKSVQLKSFKRTNDDLCKTKNGLTTSNNTLLSSKHGSKGNGGLKNEPQQQQQTHKQRQQKQEKQNQQPPQQNTSDKVEDGKSIKRRSTDTKTNKTTVSNNSDSNEKHGVSNGTAAITPDKSSCSSFEGHANGVPKAIKTITSDSVILDVTSLTRGKPINSDLKLYV